METYTLAQPAPAPAAPPPEAAGTPPRKQLPKALVIGGIVLGFIIFFVLGMLVAGSGKKSTDTTAVVPTEVPTATPRAMPSSGTPAPVNASIQYLPGKPYYDDSVAILTKTEPRQVLLVSVSRFGQDRGFTQYAKVNYFTGTAWLRDNVTSSIASTRIIGNPLVKQFTITTDKTANAQNLGEIEVTVENKPLSFTLRKISYDVSTLAFQGYTKFNYFGEGRLKTSDDEVDAYVFYTQSFAMNASDVSFLSTPEKLSSDWLVFWDEGGNAYYLDTLASSNAGNPYENYRTGVVYYADGSTMKVTDPRMQQTQANGQYTASFPLPKAMQLSFSLSSPLNKASAKTYRWQTGIVSGVSQSSEQTKSPGIGITETIHAN